MYLGIDLGTSAMKCLVMGEEQEIIYSVSSDEIPLFNLRNGWSEQDPESWIVALETCLKKLQLKIDFQQIKSISFSGHMHGATCLNEKNEVIRPCILWNDTRSHQECEEIMRDNSVKDIAGNIAMPGFTAPKVLWLKYNEPENFKSINKVLLPKDFLRFYLTGDFYSDLSDASGTYWLDIAKREWSQKLLDAGSMQISQMPKVFEGTDQTGTLKKEIADIYGYSVGGKTGTSESYQNKKKNINTFISIFPTEAPKYALLVMLENPKPAPDLVYNYRGVKTKVNRNEAGWNSVYVAGKIIKKIGPILAINNKEFYNTYVAEKLN